MSRKNRSYGRAHLRGRGKPLLPETRDAMAAMLAEGWPKAQVARAFAVDREVVRRLAERGDRLDGERVAAIRRTLPSVATVLAAAHAEQAMKTVEADPASSVKSTFGMKLALEGAGLARPQAAQPGVQVLAFVQSLTVGGTHGVDVVDHPGGGGGGDLRGSVRLPAGALAESGVSESVESAESPDGRETEA